jgi:hypothetical protein
MRMKQQRKQGRPRSRRGVVLRAPRFEVGDGSAIIAGSVRLGPPGTGWDRINFFFRAQKREKVAPLSGSPPAPESRGESGRGGDAAPPYRVCQKAVIAARMTLPLLGDFMRQEKRIRGNTRTVRRQYAARNWTFTRVLPGIAGYCRVVGPGEIRGAEQVSNECEDFDHFSGVRGLVSRRLRRKRGEISQQQAEAAHQCWREAWGARKFQGRGGTHPYRAVGRIATDKDG